jgi:hypothetical protein
VYRARHDDFFYLFEVTNSKFKLTGDIKTGMSKEVFRRKFNITESIDDEIQLTNSEGNSGFLFYFKRNTLKRITADLYLD